MKYPPFSKQKVVHQNVLQHSNAILPTPLAFAGFLSLSLSSLPLPITFSKNDPKQRGHTRGRLFSIRVIDVDC